MKPVLAIALRELAGYYRSASGYLIIAATLAVQGVLFNARALGPGPRLSGEVLQLFLRDGSGTTTAAAVLLSMRLFAEDRQAGRLNLVLASPVGEVQIVLGKYLAALLVLAVTVLSSLYMPALIAVHGKVSAGHIAAGYLGLMLVGAATLALGLLGSVVAGTQLLAGLLGAVLVGTLFLTWPLSRVMEPPLAGLVAYFSPYETHFFPAMRGIFRLSDVVYYLSVVYGALVLSVLWLQRERER